MKKLLTSLLLLVLLVFGGAVAEATEGNFSFSFFIDDGSDRQFTAPRQSSYLLTQYAIANVTSVGGDYGTIQNSAWIAAGPSATVGSGQISSNYSFDPGSNNVYYYGTMGGDVWIMLSGYGSYIEAMLTGTWSP